MSGEQQQLGVPQIRKPPVAEDDGPIPGVGLCLSGGGYRAMVFHVGALLRLNQAGFLPRIDRVSSVSGGSITAGVLGLHWNRLRFDAGGVAANLDEEVVNPLRALADRTIDAWAVIQGAVTPGVTINGRLAASYRRALFGKHTLADLPVRPSSSLTPPTSSRATCGGSPNGWRVTGALARAPIPTPSWQWR